MMNSRYEIFVRNITALNRLITRISNEEMKQFRLHGTDALVLMELQAHESGLTSTELGNLCEADKGALSRQMDHLLNEKVVRIRLNEGKRYNAKFFLTAKGKRITEKMEAIIENIVKKSSAKMDRKRRRDFYDSMEEISENMKKVIHGEEEGDQ